MAPQIELLRMSLYYRGRLKKMNTEVSSANICYKCAVFVSQKKRFDAFSVLLKLEHETFKATIYHYITILRN